MQLAQDRLGVGVVLEQGRLGQLDRDPRRVGAAVAQVRLDAREEVDAAELPRRHVDGDLRVEAALRPRDLLRARRGDHPVADRLDQAGLLGHRDELARCDEPAALGIVPAQQRLDPDEPPAAREDRLVVQLELLGHERAAQARGHRQPLERVAAGLRVDRPAPARGVLGLVHRRVGVRQQRVGVRGFAGAQRDADRGGHLELGAGDHERLREAALDLRGGALGGGERVVMQVCQQQQEAVSARAGEQVGGADRPLQACGEAADQLVAGTMAERVVDQLEAVEVDVQQEASSAPVASASLSCSSSSLRLGRPVSVSW